MCDRIHGNRAGIVAGIGITSKPIALATPTSLATLDKNKFKSGLPGTGLAGFRDPCSGAGAP